MGTTPATGPVSHGRVHATLIVIDQSLSDQSVNLPVVEAHHYALLDDDAKTCSIIDEDELYASYIDRNIDSYKLDGIETWPQVPNPDLHNVVLTYKNGTTTSVLVGSISLDDGPTPDQYFKSGGIIIPIDKTGTAQYDATNTPNLAYIRNQYWDMVGKKVAMDLLIAEMVASFGTAVAGGANMNTSGLTNYVTPGAVDDATGHPQASGGSSDGSSSDATSAPADGGASTSPDGAGN